MTVRVDAGFSDASPLWTCRGIPELDEPCGQRFFGDAVADAFRSWWEHQAAAHPRAHGD